MKETSIISNQLTKIILGTTLVGISALLIPYIYTIVPVYETAQCEKYYQLNFFNSWVDEPTLNTIFKVNIWFYLSWNWLELVILVFFTYWIRNVRDELNISLELFLINLSWILFSTLYMGFTFYSINDGKSSPDTYIQIIIITCIQLRNLITVSFSTFFCWKAKISKQLL